MLHELVDSRLAIPSPSPWHVTRLRLLTALDMALEVPLMLVSAGPGAGKTVLLAQWARRRRAHVAWLCPTPDDDEPGRFRALLTSALGVRPPDPPVPAQGRPIDYVHWLRGQLLDRKAPVVLAIDDAHVLSCPEITDLLDKLVIYGSPQLHLVLGARHDPALPLHRYRLAGQMRELRGPDLAMTLGETQEALTAHHVTLPVSALNAMAARTEGWAAGIRLMAMRMARSPAPDRLVDELSFDYGSIGEYFTAEVLCRLPPAHRRLLIETSFLDEVTASLAEAITGLDGAGEMLGELARGNWFAVALDPAGTRFRYHRLFTEVLRYLLRRNKKRVLPELAERAAIRFERDGDQERALYWSAKAGDPARAAAMLVHGGLADAFAHHRDIPDAELAGVLARASADRMTADPHSVTALAAAALGAATVTPGPAARELERTVAATLADGQPDAGMLQAASLVELMLGMRSGNVCAVDSAAARLMSHALPFGLRGAVLLARAGTHFWHGIHDDVDALLDQALTEARRCGTVRLQADVLGMIACVDSYRSRPRHADDAVLRAHSLLRGHPGLRTPPALRLAIAVRSVQRADLTTAARALRHVSVPAAVSADPGLAAALTLWRATVLALAGKPHKAHALLDEGTADLSPDLLRVHRDVLLGEIETSLGRPHAALKHFERHHSGKLAGLADVSRGRAHLALDDLEGARQSVRGVLSATRRHLSRYVLVESMLLDARIADRAHDTGRALEMITNALDVAHEDLVLPFVHAREPLADLLARHPAVADRWPSPPPGTHWSTGATVAVSRVRELPVQLTQREKSVLAYLATSMTAAEVADELYLSVNTVKTHLAAIYRKLGARGRREAVRRARELELLLGPPRRARTRAALVSSLASAAPRQ